jgi:hsp70-interacting protein
MFVWLSFHTFSFKLTLSFGIDFHKIGGFCIFRPCLDSAHGSLRWRAAEIVAELTQNNPYCQERVLEAGLLPVLLSLVDGDPAQQVRIKALYALSCELYSETMDF